MAPALSEDFKKALTEIVGAAEPCCGSGQQRIGARALVSACPFCETNLSTAAQTENSPMPVYDVIDLVYDAAGL